jgi:hypothetical protein
LKYRTGHIVPANQDIFRGGKPAFLYQVGCREADVDQGRLFGKLVIRAEGGGPNRLTESGWFL